MHPLFYKNYIIRWLNKPINNNEIMFDFVLDMFEEIQIELANNNLSLRQDPNTFLINFIDFLYHNSNTELRL
jgi:hypothetical protein